MEPTAGDAASAHRCGAETRARRTRRTRFVCISDTHNRNVALPKGDVLIHAGDMTNNGSYAELSKAAAWLEKADFECKVVVAGNHDISLDRNLSETQPSHSSQPPQDPEASISLLTSSRTITYLAHTSRTIRLTSPQGPQTTFTIFGSPSSPINPAHPPDFTAFQYPVPPQTLDPPRLWDDVPPGTDIIVTHTPPHTHLDEREPGLHTGCPSLLHVLQRIRPRLAVCGHVHEGRGAEHITWGPGGTDAVEPWVDPAPEGRKMCLVDLRRQVAGVETCVVNCAAMARSYPQGGHVRLNKPIVVDVELPVWE